MKRFFHFTAIAMLLVTFFEGRACAEVWVEDFEGGFDSRFNHEITGSHFFRTFAFVSPTNSLGLEPGTDLITFDLARDEFISYASVSFMNNCGGPCTTVEFVGTLGTQSFGSVIGHPGWQFIDTTGLDLGLITEIRLSASQSIFDDVSVNVVPEPGSAFLVLSGAWILLRKKLPSRTPKPGTKSGDIIPISFNAPRANTYGFPHSGHGSFLASRPPKHQGSVCLPAGVTSASAGVSPPTGSVRSPRRGPVRYE